MAVREENADDWTTAPPFLVLPSAGRDKYERNVTCMGSDGSRERETAAVYPRPTNASNRQTGRSYPRAELSGFAR